MPNTAQSSHGSLLNFTPRDALLVRISYGPASVCLCLSRTRGYCIEATAHIEQIFGVQDSLDLPVPYTVFSLGIWLADWCSGNVVRRINEVHRTWLILVWVTVFGLLYHLDMYPAN